MYYALKKVSAKNNGEVYVVLQCFTILHMIECFTGITKLGLSCSSSECSLVLEEDGTVVDDDDILLEVHGQTLMLMCPGEEWIPVQNSQELSTVPMQPVLNEAGVEVEHQSPSDVVEPVPGPASTPDQPHCEPFSTTSKGLFFSA